MRDRIAQSILVVGGLAGVAVAVARETDSATRAAPEDWAR